MLERPVALATGLGEDVELRRLRPGDAEAFTAHVLEAGSQLSDALNWARRTRDVASTLEFMAPYERPDPGRVLLAGAWAGQQLVGGGMLFAHDPVNASVELGIWTTAPGRGVAEATCRALLGLARAELRVERVQWHAVVGNPRSRRLAQRLGFTLEGLQRSAFVQHGERTDVWVLGLVEEEIDLAAAGEPVPGPRLAPEAVTTSAGASLTIRPLDLGDVELLRDHAREDFAHLDPWMTWPRAARESAGARDFILRHQGPRTLLVGAFEDGRLAGAGSVFGFEPRSQTVEVGIWTAAGGQGRGVARAICRVLLRHARTEFGVGRVIWRTTLDNERSQALARRLGFVPDGILRGSDLRDGEREDSWHASLIGDEIDLAAAS